MIAQKIPVYMGARSGRDDRHRRPILFIHRKNEAAGAFRFAVAIAIEYTPMGFPIRSQDNGPAIYCRVWFAQNQVPSGRQIQTHPPLFLEEGFANEPNLEKALKGLRIAARGWCASRLPRVGTPVSDNPARVAQNPVMPIVCAALTGLIFKPIRIPGVAPAAQPRAV